MVWGTIAGDQTPENDTASTIVRSGIVEVELTITTLNTGDADEIYWEIYDSVAGQRAAFGSNYEDNQVVLKSFCLRYRTYHFNAYDKFGDGWNGATYFLTKVCSGIDTIAFNNGLSPDNNLTSGANDLETVEVFNLTKCESDDIAVLSVEEKVSGCPLSATDTIKISLYNNSDTTIVNIPIYFELGLVTISDTVTTQMAAGDTLLFTFDSTVDLSMTGVYELKAWSDLGTDINRNNDTVSIDIVLGDHPVEVVIMTDTFQEDIYWQIIDTLTGVMMANDSGYLAYDTTINTICLLEGRGYKFEAFDLDIYYTSLNSWSGGTYEVRNCQGGNLLANFGNKVPFIPGQTFGLTLLVTEGFSIVPCIPKDVGILQVDSPFSSCDLSDKEMIVVEVSNFGYLNQDSIPLAYSINGGAAVLDTMIITLKPGDSQFFVFDSTADLSTPGSYNIKVWTALGGDTTTINDTILKTIAHKYTQSICLFHAGGNCEFTDDLCDDQNIQGDQSPTSKTFRVETDKIDSIALLLYYTMCTVAGQDSGKFEFSINGLTLGEHIQREKYCFCAPRDSTYPKRIVFKDSTSLALFDDCFNKLTIKHNSPGLVIAGYALEIYGDCPTGVITNVVDVGIFSFESPTLDCFSTMQPIKINVSNFGDSPINNIPIAYSIDNGPAVRDTITGAINPGIIKTYTFDIPADMSIQKDYRVDVWTALSSDLFSCNDSSINNIAINHVAIDSFPYTQTFDSTFPAKYWNVENDDEKATWESVIDGQGNNAVHMRFRNYVDKGEIDRLITPLIDLSAATNMFMTFRVSYRPRPVTKDTLRIYVSSDCGETWSAAPIYNKGGGELSTGAPQIDPWFPSASSDWRDEIIDLSSYVGSSQVQIAFEGINGFGNNLFLDDITLLETPPNDLCINAITLPTTGITFTRGNIFQGTQSIEPVLCNGNLSTVTTDVWYKFVADTSDLHIVVYAIGDFNAVMELIDDTCGSAVVNSLDCSDQFGPGDYEVIDATGLTVGNTYYVRVYNFGASKTSYEFDIFIYSDKVPSNDLCADAISLDVNETCIPIDGIANGSKSYGCAGDAIGDVWYSFEATQTDLYMKVDGYELFDAVIEIVDACDGNILYCVDEEYKGVAEVAYMKGLTVGNTYFAKIYDFDTITPLTLIFNICVSENAITGEETQLAYDNIFMVYPNMEGYPEVLEKD
ncbi:MAG: choice-of-anchor J domain-containing protein [Bacteroidetes bacterium]|nr:choice-of-anchor J domain-containing protein [Bacteroidota bacterium]